MYREFKLSIAPQWFADYENSTEGGQGPVSESQCFGRMPRKRVLHVLSGRKPMEQTNRLSLLQSVNDPTVFKLLQQVWGRQIACLPF